MYMQTWHYLIENTHKIYLFDLFKMGIGNVDIEFVKCSPQD